MLSHECVTQLQGFCPVREPKTLRFDLAVGFDAEDRRQVFVEAMADVQRAFPLRGSGFAAEWRRPRKAGIDAGTERPC